MRRSKPNPPPPFPHRHKAVKPLSLPATVPTADRADPVLDRLKHLHPKVIDLSLGRTFRMLEAIGSPHRSLPPVVHVAGTNGKGSTIAFLRAFLEAAGKRVHVYTSPIWCASTSASGWRAS